MLEQADLGIRAGNILILCMIGGVVWRRGRFSRAPLAGKATAIFVLRGIVLGGILPYSYASYRRARRFRKFEEFFPEAIDTLTRAVRAGHAFTTALELIANEMSEPIASEFRKLFEEQKFGLPVRDALLNLTERVPLVDVKFFVTAVMLQRETGGNLAEILDNLSYMIRERFKIMRQVRVLYRAGPADHDAADGDAPDDRGRNVDDEPGLHPPLFSDPIGHTLIVVGITLQTIGYFVIRKIIRIQV